MIRVNCASVSSPWSGFPGVANGSTLFLADVADLPADAQAALTRALTPREAAYDGSRNPALGDDVRLIAATRKDLRRCVEEGSLREDLYYLLSVITIQVPPLRDRREDIPLLVWRFVDEFSETLGQPVDAVDQESMSALQRYGWPGNARELRNIVERAMTIPIGRGRRLRIGIPMHETATPRANGGTNGDAQALHTNVRRGPRRTVRPATR
jgi:DNA-binding NtrC family response regulator